jgi:hypothetical protein
VISRKPLGRAFRTSLALLMIVGCDSNPLVVDTLSGDYFLKRLVMTSSNGTQTDLAAAGAKSSLTLTTDGRSTGSLFLPSTPQTGPATTLDLAGHWSQVEGVVVITTNADTFVRDIPFTWTGSQLESDRTSNGVRVQMTFAHVCPACSASRGTP